DEHVVEAVALQGSRDVRLLVILRNARTREYVWSDRCRLRIDDWVDCQQDLVRRVATALNVYLSAARLALSKHHPDPPLRAYARWLFGQSRWQTWSPAGFHEATEIFQKIIEETPDFSPAYSTLAQIQNTVHFIHPGVFREPRRTEQALNYARE